jgi:flagellar biosynthesis/type III secretory pathway M-ring protein FliF/YscJ
MELLAPLLAKLQNASLFAKLATAAVAVLLVGLLGTGFFLAKQPDWEVLTAELDDSQFARVGEALAGAEVRWRASSPPRPFVVYVDRKDRAKAFNAIMLAGALRDAERGILTENASGMGSVFMYSKEREQLTKKREWQDMESMLAYQDFIREARVRTSSPGRDRLGRELPASASVTLILERGQELTRAQARTVADLIRLGLGIEPQNLVVSDQSGKSLFDGSDVENGRREAEEWAEQAEEEDRRLEQRANQVLSEILGPGLARVTVRSDWDLAQSTTLADQTDSQGKTLLSESKKTAQTPVFGPAQTGGAAGTASNLADPNEFGVDDQSIIDVTAPGGSNVVLSEPAIGKTSEEQRTYAPGRVVSETVRRAPERRRMSVSLWLDESLTQKRATLETAVKATVGFDPKRDDQFESALVPFSKVDDQAASGAADPADKAPAPWLELLLTRGVELLSAAVFLIVLVSTLRRSKRSQKDLLAPKAPPGGAPEIKEETPVDPELLALEKVRSLLEKEPEKVGELLTAWARGEER